MTRPGIFRAFAGACRSAASFMGSRRGAAMLIGGSIMLVTVASAGGVMTNYAFREAQWEELSSAARAAVSATGPLLAGAGNPTIDRQIEERVAGFAQGLMPGLTLDANDVTVTHDAATGVTTISVAGKYVFKNIWTEVDGEANDDATGTDIDATVAVKLEVQRYEVAVALDISESMTNTIPSGVPGTRVVKLDSLKTAMESVADVMQATTSTSPGSLLVSVVPFASAINVADTATPGLPVDKGRTPAKERYVRMLAGAPNAGDTIGDTLRAARDTVTNGGGHWVDSFHQYGVGNDLGPLRKRGLPQDLLDNADWNLRRPNVPVDVSSQVPDLGSWVVDDEDFWNGCVMARWGAYWNETARPPGWTLDNAANWPATKAVTEWSAASTSLPADTPLHLSDAPPDASDPHTLFTAYSWPDAHIGRQADHRLQTVMARLLDQDPGALELGIFGTPLWDIPTQADNDWSVPIGRGGATLCPRSPITPLTDDLAVLRQAVAGLDSVGAFRPCSVCQSGAAATYLNLGIVWGLRALSPLWQQVWQVQDIQGVPRPGVGCAPGESDSGCNPLLNKSILIISDGASSPGTLLRSRIRRSYGAENPPWEDGLLCSSYGDQFLERYHDAAVEQDREDFNNHFGAYLDGARFGGADMDRVLDAFQILDRWPNDTPARRNKRGAVLETLSPWQLFRGLDAGVTDALMDENNEFGFDRRPVQMEHYCRPSSAFGSYGRADDRVYVGATTTLPSMPLSPVGDTAPLNLAGLPVSVAGDGTPGTGDFRFGALFERLAARLDDWFVESCRIAGQRRVRVNAIFIGDTRSGSDGIRTLERCVDAAGGDPDQPDVFVTPNAQAIQDAFIELFTIRRNLRYLN